MSLPNQKRIKKAAKVCRKKLAMSPAHKKRSQTVVSLEQKAMARTLQKKALKNNVTLMPTKRN